MSPSQHSKTKKERKCSMNPFMKTSSLVTKSVEIPTAEKRLLCKIPWSIITKRTIQYSLHTWLHPFSPKPIRSPPVFGTLVSIFFFIECFFFLFFFLWTMGWAHVVLRFDGLKCPFTGSSHTDYSILALQFLPLNVDWSSLFFSTSRIVVPIFFRRTTKISFVGDDFYCLIALDLSVDKIKFESYDWDGSYLGGDLLATLIVHIARLSRIK